MIGSFWRIAEVAQNGAYVRISGRSGPERRYEYTPWSARSEGSAHCVAATHLGTGREWQLVDELVEAGIVARRPDPQDRRGRIVEFTAAGRKVLHDANVVKRRIEDNYLKKLGERRFTQLMEALAVLDED